MGAVAAAGTLLPAFTPPARAAPVTLSEELGGLPVESGTRGRLSRVVRTPMAFSMIGFELSDHGEVEFRTSPDGIDWSDWVTAQRQEVAGEGPDDDAGEGRRWKQMSHPVWVGAAAYLQVRGADPTSVRPHLIDSNGLNRGPLGRVRDSVGEAFAPAEAEASTHMPRITTRAGWGADESWRGGGPKYADPHFGVVHHTVNSNSYRSSDGPALVRGIYRYHTHSNGWNDIGYNFLVDRYGRAYEGRHGGMHRGVIGAHAGGFNTGSVGVAIIGTFQDVSPPVIARDAVGEVLGWKFALHWIDPRGTTLATSRGGTRYSSGTEVRLNTVSGHRDVSSTACPGNSLYRLLGDVRDRVTVGKERWGGPCTPGGDPNTGPVWRAAGDTRIATAATVATWYWRTSDEAVLAASDGFADALAGGALAARLDAPILLTNRTSVPARVHTELERMEVRRITLLGGPTALDPQVGRELAAAGYRVRRVAGEDRYATAAAVATLARAPRGEALLVRGDDWPDAVAGGAFLSMERPPPTLLTRRDSVPDATERALADLGVERVFIVGGPSAVSEAVADQLAERYRVTRLDGANRYATSLRVVRFLKDHRLSGKTQIVFTTGADFPDALTAGPVAARRGAPVMLVPNCGLEGHDAIVEQLDASKGTYEDGVIIGGASAVSDRVRWQLNRILG